MANNIFKHIPPEKWDVLSDKDKTFLTKCGMVRDNRTLPYKMPLEKKVQRKNSAPKEYYVTQSIKCNCCKTLTISHGFMRLPFAGANFLTYKPLEQFPADFDLAKNYKMYKRQSTTCEQCHDVLSNLSKDELIEKIMRKFNGEVIYMLTLRKKALVIPEDKDTIEQDKEDKEAEMEAFNEGITNKVVVSCCGTEERRGTLPPCGYKRCAEETSESLKQRA
jgi:hypothetical protein